MCKNRIASCVKIASSWIKIAFFSQITHICVILAIALLFSVCHGASASRYKLCSIVRICVGRCGCGVLWCWSTEGHHQHSWLIGGIRAVCLFFSYIFNRIFFYFICKHLFVNSFICKHCFLNISPFAGFPSCCCSDDNDGT